MGAAAELGGPAADVHDADDLAVFFAKQGHGAHLLGLVQRHGADGHVHGVKDLVVDDLLHLGQLLGRDGAEVGEVEVGHMGVLVGACLVDMVAQHLPQGRLQQVGGGVVAGDGPAVFLVHLGGQGVAHADIAAFQHAGVDKVALGGLFHIQHAEGAVIAGQDAVVSHLAAHLGVEGGLVQDDKDAFLGLVVGGDAVGQGLLVRQGHHHTGVGQGVVAGKDGGGGVQRAEQVGAPARDVLLQPLGARTLLLLGHLSVEAFLVHFQALLGRDLAGQVQGEAEGVVQLKDIQAAQHVLVGLFHGVDQVGQDVHAGVDGAGKVGLLGADHLLDVGGVLPQLGVSALAGLDHRLHQVHQEGALDAQQPAVAGRAAQQAAQHIAAALVGGQDAVRHHEGAAADVVGDDADGDIGLFVLAVGLAGDVLHMVQHALDGVHLEQVAHALHHAGQALEAHAGVDVGAGQPLIVALAVRIELAEHQVPDLHKAVAVAAGAAGGLAAAVLDAAVEIDLGAGAAGAGAVLPEVVLLAHADHVVGGDAHLLGPDVIGLVVVQVDRDIQLVLGNGHPLLAGQKLPGPGDDFLFEIILEREVAQHLKEGAVPRGDAHPLDVGGADALLAGGHTVAGRLLLAQEPLFHGGHAAVDQQQAGVVLGHQGEAAQAQVALALKEGQVFFTQFIQTGPLHKRFSPCSR